MDKKQRSAQARRVLDANLVGIPAHIPVPKAGWTRSIREALGMTREQLGKRMESAGGKKGLSASAVQSLERTEVEGTATLASLDRAAQAMGCKFVYAIVPEESLEDIVQKQAAAIAAEASEWTRQTMLLEGEQVAAVDVSEEASALIGTSALWA